jgi:ABC-type sugar transport system permease subunit
VAKSNGAAVVPAPAKEAAEAPARLWRRILREFADPERRVAYYMVGPALIIIAAIAIYPILYAIVLSFQYVVPNHPSHWVGLDNYVKMVHDPDYLNALTSTIVFTVSSVILEVSSGMTIALALNRRFAGRGFARATAIAPWAFPTAISAVMWRLMFQNQVGIMWYVAEKLNIYTGDILSSQGALMAAAILVDVWKTTPFMALLLLAGLQVIPGDVYEAARVDGANAWQQFWRVTLPLVKPALLVALLFRSLDAWRIYDLFWVMGGRQLNSLSTYVYTGVRVSQLDFSLGDAAAVFVFFSSLAIAAFFIKVLGTRPTE